MGPAALVALGLSLGVSAPALAQPTGGPAASARGWFFASDTGFQINVRGPIRGATPGFLFQDLQVGYTYAQGTGLHVTASFGAALEMADPLRNPPDDSGTPSRHGYVAALVGAHHLVGVSPTFRAGGFGEGGYSYLFGSFPNAAGDGYDQPGKLVAVLRVGARFEWHVSTVQRLQFWVGGVVAQSTYFTYPQASYAWSFGLNFILR
jgi:hypothetical protein